MTSANDVLGRTVYQLAAAQAILAPSVHNTQPWTFVIADDALEVRSDPTRQLSVLDPRGRQLVISCGCALFNARVAIAAAGFESIVERLPDLTDPSLLARVRIGREVAAHPLAPLADAIEDRRTNRREYLDEPVPPEVLHNIALAVRAEGAELVVIDSAEQRRTVAELSELANTIEASDPAYRAELQQWTTDDPRRRDGVQASTVPYAGQGAEHTDTVPIREFDTRGMGWLPSSSHSDANRCLLLLCTPDDDSHAWLRAGEALEHLWLVLTDLGYWASLLTQPIEVRSTNDGLRHRLALSAHPQLLLRVGKAPYVGRTPRRPLDDVVVDATKPDTQAG